MKTTIETAVAALFENYGQTPQLRDFQEEITMNLMERARDLMKGGLGEAEAVGKALAELGDITEIADSIGRAKRQEAIGEFYLSHKPLDHAHAVGYAVAAAAFILGAVGAFMLGFRGHAGHAVLAFAPFGLASVCAFVYLGLTQDTRAHYPMPKKRAVLFMSAAGLLFSGVTLGATLMFWDAGFIGSFSDLLNLKIEVLFTARGIAVLLGLILPGVAWLAYLILTQEKRFKPWVLEQNKQYMEAFAGGNAGRFGLFSAFLWTLAAAVFVLLGFTVGWHPAWVVFLFGAAAEMLLLAVMFRKKEK